MPGCMNGIGTMSGNDFQDIVDGNVENMINIDRIGSRSDNWVELGELLLADVDFLDLLFIKLAGKYPSAREKKALLLSMLCVSMGTGYHPPSVCIPRIIASTTKDEKFAVINGLIGGLAGMGTHHLGAVHGVMALFQAIAEDSDKQGIEESVRARLNPYLISGDKVPGFGHPVYRDDPRVAKLRRTLIALGEDIYSSVFDETCLQIKREKGIGPNIDSILALAYLRLGFLPVHGIYLSFIGRSLNMMCHIMEELPRKAFSFLNESVMISSGRNKEHEGVLTDGPAMNRGNESRVNNDEECVACKTT